MGRGQAEVKLMGALDDILLGTAAAAAKRTVLAVVRKEKYSYCRISSRLHRLHRLVYISSSRQSPRSTSSSRRRRQPRFRSVHERLHRFRPVVSVANTDYRFRSVHERLHRFRPVVSVANTDYRFRSVHERLHRFRPVVSMANDDPGSTDASTLLCFSSLSPLLYFTASCLLSLSLCPL